MFGFNDSFNDIMGSIQIEPVAPPVNDRFEEFKHWATHYVQEHSDNEIAPNDQLIEQIQNSVTIDDVEAFLRDNDYCDDCLLKMYRRFASGEQFGCGCGHMEPEVVQIQPEVQPEIPEGGG